VLSIVPIVPIVPIVSTLRGVVCFANSRVIFSHAQLPLSLSLLLSLVLTLLSRASLHILLLTRAFIGCLVLSFCTTLSRTSLFLCPLPTFSPVPCTYFFPRSAP
jgi:hypothetical protein